MTENKTKVSEELSKAGETSVITPLLLKLDTFNQDYIIRHEDDSRMPWEWDLRRLFDNAMASRAQMNQADLQAAVMQLSGIQQPKYYDKVFRLACDNHIVKTTMDRNGRVVVISTPS